MSCDLATLSETVQSGDPEQAAQALDACAATLTDPALWYWLLGATLVCGLVGALIGKYKNALVRDTLLGLALGPIGWVISLLLPAHTPPSKCPSCHKDVQAQDSYCRSCGVALPTQVRRG